ncbi:RluA family pseudouridine synthase [Patescibacteria group bacterium]|nr:RluA family pseudouridine synthase [Patescibacteria group bacterium]
MDIPVIYEDHDVIVINKPPGIVVNNAQSVKGETVQDWAALRFKSQIANPNLQKIIDKTHWSLSFGHCDFCSRAGIVHRIDKETSGILLIAKTPEIFAELQRQFKEREIKKVYLAVCHGSIVPPEGEIRAPVGRLPWNRERFGIVPGGKDAVTKYNIIASLECRTTEHNTVPASLAAVYPETGRTHQIRVHLKYIGHPVVGDYLYAGRIVSREDRTWAPRVMLHAWKISFRRPNGSVLSLTAPVPEDMRRLFGDLEIPD